MKKTKRVIAILLSFLMVCFSTATAFADTDYSGSVVNTNEATDTDTAAAAGANANTSTSTNTNETAGANANANTSTGAEPAAGTNDTNSTNTEQGAGAASGTNDTNSANTDAGDNSANANNSGNDENKTENENGKLGENANTGDDDVVNTDDCTCGATDGVHSESCPQYVAPIGCAECGQTDGHLKSCSLYEVKSGDTVWVLKGSLVYKTAEISNDSKTLDKNYEVTVKEVTKDAAENVWYKFNYKFSDFGSWLGQLFTGYEYVQACNTSVNEPAADEYACTCGENAPEDLSQHADNCPRKAYVKSLIQNENGGYKTAEEIYADWDSYDADMQKDILHMVKAYAETTYDDLLKLVNQLVDKEITTEEGISVKVQGVPKDAVLSVKKVEIDSYPEGVTAISGDKEINFAFDITLTQKDKDDEDIVWQPADGQSVTVTLDAEALGLQNGEYVRILHNHNYDIEKLGVYKVTDGKLTFTTNGFSEFFGYTVDFEWNGTTYSIEGGSEIYLSSLFAGLGIGLNVNDVESVFFTDENLIEFEHMTGLGYGDEQDWLLRSLQAFDTEENLLVMFDDGEAIAVKVSDDQMWHWSGDTTKNDDDYICGGNGDALTIDKNMTLYISGTVTVRGTITIPEGVKLSIRLANGATEATLKRGSSFKGNIFVIQNGGTLDIQPDNNYIGEASDAESYSHRIYLDGNHSDWILIDVSGSTRKLLNAGSGVQAEDSFIDMTAGGELYMNHVTMQNMYVDKSQSAAAVIDTDGISTGTKDENGKTKYKDDVSTIAMRNCTVQQCAQQKGNRGAVRLVYCNASMTNCDYNNNATVYNYGGVLTAFGSYHATLDMDNCTAEYNYSSGWGGFMLWASNRQLSTGKISKATIKNCNFSYNTARYLGGAISNEAEMEIIGTTIENNTAMSGGGIAAFPFTLTENSDTSNSRKDCGLTLGSGNVIRNNNAVAKTSFKPFAYNVTGKDSTGKDIKVPVDDETYIDTVYEYPAGGGGIWFYASKEKWSGSMNIGSGNTIQNNEAANIGGGVFVSAVKATTTSLNITGAAITKNDAKSGGGVAVQTADVNITSGGITSNVVSANGGGIYVDNGNCNVSGTGSVSNNKAANGGGIYINSGALTVNGGLITGNKAEGTFTGQTAQNAEAGVGGGIYVNAGSFTMNSKDSGGNPLNVGLHSNTAGVAANDAYATGGRTTLSLPNVKSMQLAGWNGTGSPDGWYADYMPEDTLYPSTVIKKYDANGNTLVDTTNPGRYSYTDPNKLEVLYDEVLRINTNPYYCLTIGTPHPGYGNLTITKTLTKAATEDQTFLFEVKGTSKADQKDYSLTVTVVIAEGQKTASVLVANIPDGTYTVSEKEDWSWRYDEQTRKYYPNDKKDDGNKYEKIVIGADDSRVGNLISYSAWFAEFVNKLTENHWLSGDCYCENHWTAEEEGEAPDDSQAADAASLFALINKDDDALTISKDDNDETEV